MPNTDLPLKYMVKYNIISADHLPSNPVPYTTTCTTTTVCAPDTFSKNVSTKCLCGEQALNTSGEITTENAPLPHPITCLILYCP